MTHGAAEMELHALPAAEMERERGKGGEVRSQGFVGGGTKGRGGRGGGGGRGPDLWEGFLWEGKGVGRGKRGLRRGSGVG